MSTSDNQEQLRTENEFLKMKMMLENGAQFHTASESELPPEIENEFLNSIMEFERQIAQQKMITVYEKIGKPTQFLPVEKIPDEDIPGAWEKLSAHLFEHGISLNACSPAVTERELYRFATEELFNHDIGDVNIPGVIHGFIYDEFHPDINYDNTRQAIVHCIERILNKRPMECLFGFGQENLRLNDHYPLTEDQFMALVNNFKLAYDEFEEPEISNVSCQVDETACVVKGVYAITVRVPPESIVLTGTWEVQMKQESEPDYWFIDSVRMEGIRF